jgi:hypothetical protein
MAAFRGKAAISRRALKAESDELKAMRKKKRAEMHEHLSPIPGRKRGALLKTFHERRRREAFPLEERPLEPENHREAE